MSVSFGFPIGDLIAAIELVGTVIDALRSSGSAATEYCELVSQLLSLEIALLQVKRLEFEEEQYAEVLHCGRRLRSVSVRLIHFGGSCRNTSLICLMKAAMK